MFYPVISREARHFFRLWQPWRAVLAQQQEVEAAVRFGKEKFEANLDVQDFKPENITVKVTDDNTVTVEGKHEEKQEGEGYVSRHFFRRFVLPQGHDLSKVESKLSSDGILSISAPRIAVEEDKGRTVPIMKTGQPYLKQEGEKKEEIKEK